MADTLARRIRAAVNEYDHCDSPVFPVAALKAVLDRCDQIRDDYDDALADTVIAQVEQAIATALGIEEAP